MTTTGEVVVLHSVKNEPAYFDADDGGRLRRVNLVAALGCKPNYASGVGADVEERVLFEDFGGSPPIWRLGVRRSLDRRLGEGRSCD